MKRKCYRLRDHKRHIPKTVTHQATASYSTVLNSRIIADLFNMSSAHYETSLYAVHKSFCHLASCMLPPCCSAP